jgi:hypothetical protein
MPDGAGGIARLFPAALVVVPSAEPVAWPTRPG